MAKRRNTPELNLTPELPEVRSSDFNLFYKPEVEPLPAGLETFAKSLDAFVNDGLVDAYVLNEKKKKKEGEAEAEKDFKSGKESSESDSEIKANKTSFFNLSNKGKLPKEANPYYLEKYQELGLNQKAELFKQKIAISYAEKKVSENPSPTAFQDFYKDELKLFIAENQLGSHDAIMLEKGFFSKTSAMKNQLFQTHVTSQMSRIGEEFDTNFINTFQGLLDKSLTMEDNGKNITKFFKSYDGILSNGTKQKLFFQSLTDYVDKTGDYEYAKQVLAKLPKHVKLGTDAIGNVKGLADDFQVLKDKIEDREDQQLTDNNTRTEANRKKEYLEAVDVADTYLTFSEAKQSDEYKNASNYKKNEIEKVYKNKTIGFNSQTSPEIKNGIIEKLGENDIEGAMKYLNDNRASVSANYYNETKELIKKHEISGDDGLLSTPSYTYFENEIIDIQKDYDRAFKQTGIKMDYNPFMKPQFKEDAIEWLADNPITETYSASQRKKDFRNFLRGEIEELKKQTSDKINKVVSNFSTNTIDASKEDLPSNKKTKDRKENKDEKKEIINNEDTDEGVNKKTKKVDSKIDITTLSTEDLNNRLEELKTMQKRKSVKDEIKRIEAELDKR